MDYAQFKKLIAESKEDLYKKTFAENRDSIRVKKEQTAMRNLEKIFCAVLRISNEKGFQTMSMRDLSKAANLSMGALYAYFSSKEELLGMLQRQGRELVRQMLTEQIEKEKTASARLRVAIKISLYLSEAMQPWFYFSYMETKNLNEKERKKAIAGELHTETMITDILASGEAEGIFRHRNHRLSASVINAMLQEWYLKRWKYARRGISVDHYAGFILDFVESFYLTPPTVPSHHK
ncbi:TetR family transcriptional regulator [Desulfonema ishimotonii]|uniref:TetR family transcriptional regulator n=2 Tax=Desulfonema ishimotonii TaxID=45657 RepID=A0A401FRT5_9BACT|nr:TetR family transcriptional regulator [Desulfonema ishimotonii]